MNKKRVLWIFLALVFLMVFNMIFFMAGGTEHGKAVWISYGFIHFAYLMSLITPFLVKKSTNIANFGIGCWWI